MQLARLKHLYLNIFWFIKIFHVCGRNDGRNDIQFVKSIWSICIHSLKPMSYFPSRGEIMDVKRTHTCVNTVQRGKEELKIKRLSVIIPMSLYNFRPNIKRSVQPISSGVRNLNSQN